MMIEYYAGKSDAPLFTLAEEPGRGVVAIPNTGAIEDLMGVDELYALQIASIAVLNDLQTVKRYGGDFAKAEKLVIRHLNATGAIVRREVICEQGVC